MNHMDSTNSSSRWGRIIELQPQQLVRVALLGFVVGIAAWLVMLFARDVALSAIPCGEATSETCTTMTASTAGIISVIAAGFVGLLGLVKLGVYRPIIVIVAVVICLWSLSDWTRELPWFESITWYGILYAVLYALFSWLVRPRSVVIVLLITIPVVAMIRWIAVL